MAGLNAGAMTSALTKYTEDSQHLLDLNLQISKLYQDAVDSGKSVAKVDPLIADYNRAMRDTAKTIIQGTQYVALDIPVNQIEYYQRIPAVFETAIADLDAGNGDKLRDTLYGLDSEDLGQYSVWYSEGLEYDTWVNQYHEALDPENPDSQLPTAQAEKILTELQSVQ